MKRIRGAISLVPGPTHVLRETLELYKIPFGSPDLDEAFFVTYKECTERLAGMLEVDEGGSAALMSGEVW
jgi:aspartate aminotransferase-like enzyme